MHIMSDRLGVVSFGGGPRADEDYRETVSLAARDCLTLHPLGVHLLLCAREFSRPGICYSTHEVIAASRCMSRDASHWRSANEQLTAPHLYCQCSAGICLYELLYSRVKNKDNSGMRRRVISIRALQYRAIRYYTIRYIHFFASFTFRNIPCSRSLSLFPSFPHSRRIPRLFNY